MPYVTPPIFNFQAQLVASDAGDAQDVTPAEFQTLFSNVTALATQHVATWNVASDGRAVTSEEGTGELDPAHDFSAIIIEHFRQFLYYKSQSQDRTGLVRSFNTGLSEDTELPYAPDGGWYDLDDGVEWMVPGRLYIVEHVIFAFEVDT